MGSEKILVCGGGGFIGGHLVADLLKQGHRDIRAVDIKPFDEWYQLFPQVENLQLDLQEKTACEQASQDAQQVYNLAADMGGMGFIENNRARCMLSVLINTHLLMAAKKFGVARFFYASSACVYAADKQTSPGVKLKRSYNLKAPKGVNGRNSDNTLIQNYLGWAPDTRLRDGMEKTYRWIHAEMTGKLASA